MSVMYIVLPLAFLFAGIAVWAFIWAVRQGQLDDLDTPAVRMLLDDDEPRTTRPTSRVAHERRAETASQPRHDAG